MKINGIQLFLLFFTEFLWYILTGFENAVFKNVYAAEQQSVTVPLGQVIKKETSVNLKQKVEKNNPSVLRVDAVTESPKALILSIPFDQSGSVWLRNEQRSMEMESINIFAAESKNKQRPLYLDSQMLMSQEPEMDKRKSVDGAGIVINLKR